MSDYYEINVSFNGWHLFATAPRSITSKSELQKVYNIFARKFPESEGYEITVTYWELRGKYVDPNNIEDCL